MNRRNQLFYLRYPAPYVATARVRALASRYGSLAEGSAFEEQVANCCLSTIFWISLIQQPEPSGSKAGG
jgi:hypothetical protein